MDPVEKNEQNSKKEHQNDPNPTSLSTHQLF